ncbi:DUF416 family protein [Orbaceae bacterium ac157xtp]
MIKNPIHLRLAKLDIWQLRVFMAVLCERMYPNFVLYSKQIESEDYKVFKSVLDLVWESMITRKAKINFDNQLEKLEEIIPTVSDESLYTIYPAIDACQGLVELLHAILSGEEVERAIDISQISLKTIIELEEAKLGNPLSEDELKNFEPVADELDFQWEIYRLLLSEENYNIELIKGIKEELREELISNIGVFLSD